MSEHPYAGGQTLTPGEAAEDDPFNDKQYCPECDEEVEVIGDECPFCGLQIE